MSLIKEAAEFNLPCIVCWDEGIDNGTTTGPVGYPQEFLDLPIETRGKLSMEALCERHKNAPVFVRR